MNTGLKSTDYHFAGQTKKYTGKVRDVYEFDHALVMVASDRISAFDVVLPEPIPYKGQVLNQIAARFLAATADIVPNWVESVPDPNVTVGKKCDPFKVEMVIRGYLAGHAAREYKAGKRILCGVNLPDGLKENDKLPTPIITPTTKASEGHDEDISREEILKQGIVEESLYIQLEEYTQALFQRGTEMAAERGLILVDTKYEFGLYNGEIILIDEIHTPDSSRYFYADTYADLQAKEEPQRQLSKEFVRQWLISEGFQGKDGQTIPDMSEEKIKSISDRYIELYEKIIGDTFDRVDTSDIYNRIKGNIENSINLQ
ncbi:phosphoribosylaminoimidazole-succinocarboxamide synthase [Reichenbachiella agariperforans]|uniref:Phosphoribosylaminoimidazole-succinocarboxamide synthase n=1 Tax=Reichenbachiella agariperforans TaxID=156994 RepID=A0A1M6R530_REIAG|nr:phosphoribosylaminoimidazolesuccinocarboxamide synthase [Reichenbachiella agariperforans]SHK27552.1 phosphoribosylaminoimidazole-succinocarboxamide synthase [Reichenbachiella agariperforans]